MNTRETSQITQEQAIQEFHATFPKRFVEMSEGVAELRQESIGRKKQENISSVIGSMRTIASSQGNQRLNDHIYHSPLKMRNLLQ
jgi:hypothetical protein